MLLGLHGLSSVSQMTTIVNDYLGKPLPEEAHKSTWQSVVDTINGECDLLHSASSGTETFSTP